MPDSPVHPALNAAEKEGVPLGNVACSLLIAALAWYLLRELANLLRPLLLAVFLAYIIVPMHRRMRQRYPGAVSRVLVAGVSMAGLYLLGLLIFDSAVRLSQDLPELIVRGEVRLRDLGESWTTHAPWLRGVAGNAATAQEYVEGLLKEAAGTLVNTAANVLTEALVVGFYLVFLLLEVGRFPERVRGAFAAERADHVLEVASRINAAVARYLRVKVQASLVLAVPAALVLWAFGVRFALLWGVLTFFANFIPYLGSVIACGLPLMLAFLQLDPGWPLLAVTGLLVSVHMLSAYLVEPAMTGKAVGLSPLVLLVSLAFWGQCWGLIGMLLAVPLTVMLRIILENVEYTRPLARLMGDE